MPTLSVTPVDDAEAEVWSLAREVAGLLKGLPWILIGGLMVRIIEAEHGVSTEWTTGDVDAVLDIRAMSTATEEASRRLVAAGSGVRLNSSVACGVESGPGARGATTPHLHTARLVSR